MRHRDSPGTLDTSGRVHWCNTRLCLASRTIPSRSGFYQSWRLARTETTFSLFLQPLGHVQSFRVISEPRSVFCGLLERSSCCPRNERPRSKLVVVVPESQEVTKFLTIHICISRKFCTLYDGAHALHRHVSLLSLMLFLSSFYDCYPQFSIFGFERAVCRVACPSWAVA